MGGEESAYDALGLEPGADSAAIERAYKRLIKRHHPDREGGDAKRAAEINSAYRELRGTKDALEFNEDLTLVASSGSTWVGLALATAALGVLWLTVRFGQLPWVGLALAASFGSYAALRKTARLGALEGLALETWLLFPLAAGYWLWLARNGQSGFFEDGPTQQLALLAAGPITSVPLLLFAAGARRIPLSLAGVLQYISPTLQLLLGVLIWHEPFQPDKVLGYALIWLALLIYSVESLWVWRRRLAHQ